MLKNVDIKNVFKFESAVNCKLECCRNCDGNVCFSTQVLIDPNAGVVRREITPTNAKTTWPLHQVLRGVSAFIYGRLQLKVNWIQHTNALQGAVFECCEPLHPQEASGPTVATNKQHLDGRWWCTLSRESYVRNAHTRGGLSARMVCTYQ